MKRSPRGRARRSRRLVVQLALMAAVVVGSTLGAGIYLIEQQRARIAEREMARAQDVALNAAARREASVGIAVDGLVRRIEGDPGVLRQLIGRDPLDRQLASILARGTDLQVLELADDDGRILASLHWPDRVGLGSPYGDDERPRYRIDTPQGERIGWFHSRKLRVGQQKIALLAGRFMESDWLDEAAALAEIGWWVPADGSSGLTSNSTESIDAAPDLAQVRQTVVDLSLQVGRWRLQATPFADSDGIFGNVVLGLHDRGDRSAWRGLRGAWLGLTLVAALAAALVGLVLGRRATRPVDQLVRAVDAIAAGKEDYDFPGIPKDEFDELVASFSRLQRSLEQQQRRSAAAERVAAWRDVARHVAHEVKNPLAPIRLTVQNLQRARQEHPEAFDRLFEEGTQTILEEVDQLSRLVGEFSEFARLPDPDPAQESLERLLDEVLELFAADPGLTIVRRSGDVPSVHIDRDQISRVFKNIVGNAVDAMAAARTRELYVETAVVDGYAEIRFADTGPGFVGDAERRVFEPYFTTKSHGTGLGMAISFRIVAEHGGEIVAENRSEGGARVTVRLPLTA
ncbi:MAG: HAMP domain-containing sensor histidine kinase [Acidobacteria bacterium]|nr:MAG: HAMP domain-containing sensor histidine kinase [Acidobacteriota bacterium]